MGYEWDMVADNGASPDGLEVVSTSATVHEYGYTSQHNATVFYPTPSSFVFAAGTIGWARGLSDEGIASVRVQRVTENILFRAGLFPEARVAPPPSSSYELGISTRSRVVAGSGKRGHTDGAASTARFNSPSGIALGPAGELYVCDTGNNRVRKIEPDGHVSTVLGDGDVKLDCPTGIAVDASGNVYVSDTGSSRILFLSADGRSGAFAGRAHAKGYVDDPDRDRARFNLQRGLAIDDSGLLYVADFRNGAIRRIDLSTGAVSTAVSSASGVTAVAVAPDGTIYYIATYAGAIVKVLPSGEQTVLANQKQSYGDRSGPGAQAALRPADGLILTRDGLVFTDTANNRVRVLQLDSPNTVVTLLGNGHGGSSVGKGSDTELSVPRSIAAVPDGYVVADTANHRIVHFSNDPSAFLAH